MPDWYDSWSNRLSGLFGRHSLVSIAPAPTSTSTPTPTPPRGTESPPAENAIGFRRVPPEQRRIFQLLDGLRAAPDKDAYISNLMKKKTTPVNAMTIAVIRDNLHGTMPPIRLETRTRMDAYLARQDVKANLANLQQPTNPAPGLSAGPH
jgi:hypothetical protein